MKQSQNLDQPMAYQIQVQGRLDEKWSDWFSGMKIAFESGITTFTGTIADQSALRGILDKIWDLNLTLVSVIQIEMNSQDES